MCRQCCAFNVDIFHGVSLSIIEQFVRKIFSSIAV